MSSEIGWVFMLALVCAACGAQLWSSGVHRRGAQFAKELFERQANAPDKGMTGTHWPTPDAPAASEFDTLLRRANVRHPRAALSLWAFATGAIALACSARSGPLTSLVALGASALCAYALLAWRAQKRRREIVRQLPAFLDDIVRLVSIGNGVQAAFQAACANAPAPLAGCLEDVMPRVRGGDDIDEALAAAARMYRVKEFELIGAVLRISIKFGGDSGLMLERMAVCLRDLDQADRERFALSAETRSP